MSTWEAVRQPELARWVKDPSSCVDPYWLLAAAMDFSAFSPVPDKLPVLIEMAVPGGCQPLSGQRCNTPDNGNSRFVARWMKRTQLKTLIRLVRSGRASRFQLGAPRTAGLGARSGISIAAPASGPVADGAPAPALPSSRIYLGIIDDGFPFAHPNFARYDDETGRRSTTILSVWDQTRRSERRRHWKRHGFGQLLSGASIDVLTRKAMRRGHQGEAEVYEQAKYKPGMVDTPHGCGVAHLFAGQAVKLADASRDALSGMKGHVVCVQLPDDRTIEDTAGGWLGFYALAGIRHIVEAAAEHAGGTPWHVVVNISYGGIAGPHDGTSMLEQAMAEAHQQVAELGRDCSLDIVLAAGNTRGKRIHAQRELGAHDDKGKTFRFFTPPDNPRESYLELWIPEKDETFEPKHIGVTLTAPTGEAVTLRIGQAQVLNQGGEHGLCAGIVFAHRVAQGRRGTMVLVLVRPTQACRHNDCAPAGVWTLNVTNASDRAVTLHGWVERNDMVVRRRRVQQARFVEDPDDPKHVNDDLTLSSVAGGEGVLVVGALRQSDREVAPYSGGDARVPEIKPDYFAMSDRSPALPGVIVPGFHSGNWSRMSGTSVAAPWVARWIVSGQSEKVRAVRPGEAAPPASSPEASRTILPTPRRD
ncbi:MAG TPA: hypothetical protein VF169_23700 [Albitalea sp.]|uniref:hypothetical protein n=1 Tax=Piscinibacter sp. TaxID=1903157 RepID=UPI002ED09D90